MKKYLCVFLLVLSIFINAQISENESFETPNLSSEKWSSYSLSSFGNLNITPSIGKSAGACDDSNAYTYRIQRNSFADPGSWILTYSSPFYSNGENLSYSFQYLALGNVKGSISAEYSINNGATYINIFPKVTLLGSQIFCTMVSGVIPAASVPTGSTFKFRIIMKNEANLYGYNMGIDNFKLSQTIDSIPSCTSFKTPSTLGIGTVVDYNDVNFTWSRVPDASSYRLKIGTTPGGSEVYNENLFNENHKILSLPQNKILYASVIPANFLGEATACPEISFQTNGVGGTSYCTAGASSDSGLKIKKVQLSKVIADSQIVIMTNSSTFLGGYEDFTSIVTDVNKPPTVPSTTYFVDVYSDNATSNMANYNAYMWIDTDHNGFFDNGSYVIPFNSYGIDGFFGNWRLGFSLPVSILQGNTRMRIRIDKSDEENSVADPCGIGKYGQVEDYTLNVIQTDLGVVENEKNKISLYPNPFHDVLRLSDMKDIKSVVVSDFSGRIIKTLIPSKELDLSELQPGIYMISLNMQDGNVRIIKAIKK